MRPTGNSRDVLLTDLAKVIALRVTAQVVIELIDEDRGQHACVVGQRQAGWQIWNLPHHLQNLPQACKTDDSSMCKRPAGLCPHKHPLHSVMPEHQLLSILPWAEHASPRVKSTEMGPRHPGSIPASGLLEQFSPDYRLLFSHLQNQE